MEKYSQYRDRGSGIAPFFQVRNESSTLYLPFNLFLFVLRLPILLSVSLSYFLILQWLPIGSLGKKACLWLMIGTPGIWWIDLQIDGVKKGSLAKHHKQRLPQPGSVIACSFTSPLDALYLAAIFDPVFTASYPSTRRVQRLSLFQAVLHAFQSPHVDPPRGAKLSTIAELSRQYPHQSIVIFPECTTTNGRGILPLAPSLLSVPPKTKIFPISVRYTIADITTPLPNTYFTFIWNLLSSPTHCIRVRIAESVFNISSVDEVSHGGRTSSSDTLLGSDDEAAPSTASERKLLDQVADALARLGRVKRVAIGVKEKQAFITSYNKR